MDQESLESWGLKKSVKLRWLARGMAAKGIDNLQTMRLQVVDPLLAKQLFF